jgi:hypothetical protein
VRVVLSSCVVLALLTVAAPVQAQEPQSGSRLRPLDASAARLFALATAWSPSVRRLVGRLERSDLIVYIRVDRHLTRNQGETRFITAARGARYIMVDVSGRGFDVDLVARLGHELQHVTEIAEATTARDIHAVLDLFKRIGWPGSSENGFETDAAIDVGRRVASEIRGVNAQPFGD